MKSVVPSWSLVPVLLLFFLVADVSAVFGVSISVAWDPSTDPDANGYNLYFGVVGGTSTNQLPLGKVTTSTVNGLTAGTTYFAYVTATSNSGGESQPSNYLTYTPGTTTTPKLQLAPVADETIPALTTMQLTLMATETGVTGPVFSYSIVSGPTGLTVDSTSGVLTWTPTAAQALTTNSVTVQVFDNSSPPLSSSTSFKVIVTQGNFAPSIVSIGGQNVSGTTSPGIVLTANVGQTLSATITATDRDLPTQTLTYSLVSGPTGATVDAASGVFKWAPTTAQSGQSYIAKVKVSDNGNPVLSDTESFTINVPSLNTAPVLALIPNLLGSVGKPVTYTLTATDAETPSSSLVYSLVSGASGATVDPITGLFSWTPGTAQGGTTVSFSVRVTDNGTPALSDSQTFQVAVVAPNTPPVLPTISTKTIPEGALFSFALGAKDTDSPAQTLTYQLVSGPVGASVDSVRGTFSWTPTEAQGPSTNSVTVRVTDNGSPALSDTETFTIIVQEVNRAPVLADVPDQTVAPGQVLMLSLTAVDPDIPANNLTYQLVSGPSGIRVDPATGVLTWRLSKSEKPSTNSVTVAVTDDGAPALSSSTTFTIVVTGKHASTVQSPYLVTNLGTVSWVAEVAPGQQLRFTHALPAAKLTSPSVHYLEVSEDLVHWSTIGQLSDLTELRDSDAMGTKNRFYRIRTETDQSTNPNLSTEISAN